MAFVEVDRGMFCEALASKGFVPDLEAQGELTYQRQHHLDPTMWVKIFTSLPKHGGNTRAIGADAIRVLLMFKNERTGKSGCLKKMPKVLRTGTPEAVIERTIERARAAYAEGNKRFKMRK